MTNLLLHTDNYKPNTFTYNNTYDIVAIWLKNVVYVVKNYLFLNSVRIGILGMVIPMPVKVVEMLGLDSMLVRPLIIIKSEMLKIKIIGKITIPQMKIRGNL